MSLRHPSTPGATRPRALAGALLIVLLAATLAGAGAARAADASAGATCPATIAGQELGRGTVEVGKNDTIRVEGEGGSSNVVSLQFGGTTFASQKVPPGGTTIDVADYAVWGVGLYQVLWQGANGCTVLGTVHVDGSFLGSRIGWASAGTIALALPLLLVLGWKTMVNPRGRWKLKVVARGDLKRDDDGWRFRWGLAITQTFLGTLLGLVLSGATLATLAGTATSVPSLELALQLTIPLTAIGFLLGLGRLRRPRERGVPGRVALA